MVVDLSAGEREAGSQAFSARVLADGGGGGACTVYVTRERVAVDRGEGGGAVSVPARSILSAGPFGGGGRRGRLACVAYSGGEGGGMEEVRLRLADGTAGQLCTLLAGISRAARLRAESGGGPVSAARGRPAGGAPAAP